ncbi:type IIL restriction-modification enzyme MmeI, partial [Priestia megaterium]|uniref:type IIL restriction-modification enzyme MmeI n=1 Tax=Priestia megaterium TaxID=1404 RepID=UPI0035B6036E
RACLWIKDDQAEAALSSSHISELTEKVREARLAATKDVAAQKLANKPYRFRDQNEASSHLIALARHSSESRNFLPADLLPAQAVISDAAFAAYDAPIWMMSLLVSRMHC